MNKLFRNPERVAAFAAHSDERNPFRVAKEFMDAFLPRVSKQTLGWNSPTLSALFKTINAFSVIRDDHAVQRYHNVTTHALQRHSYALQWS
jgi:hypothetical protein